MTLPYLLFVSSGIALSTAGTTITHSLSRTAANLRVLALAMGGNTNSFGIVISTVTANTAVLIGVTAGVTADVSIFEWHSIQGGPTG